MSLFSRVARRSGVRGAVVTAFAQPKRIGTVHRLENEEEAQPLRRTENEEEVQPVQRTEEEEQAQAIRRVEDEEEAQPMRRLQDEEEAQAIRRVEDEEEVQPVRRLQDEEQAQTLRRVEDEEEAQPMRRLQDEEQAQALRRVEDEEEAQALRRLQDEEEAQPMRRLQDEEEAQPMRRLQDEEEEAQPLRRSNSSAATLDAENSPPPDDLSGQPEPSDLQALHRDVAQAGITGSGNLIGGADGGRQNPADPFGDQAPVAGQLDFADPDLPVAFSGQECSPSGKQAERPRVTIEQVDVIIHEPATAKPSASGAISGFSNTVRARYLGGL